MSSEESYCGVGERRGGLKLVVQRKLPAVVGPPACCHLHSTASKFLSNSNGIADIKRFALL